MSDFKVGDLVTINYGDTSPNIEIGIVAKIDYSVESGIRIYRVFQANYDWTLPYTEHELRRYNYDKPVRQPKAPNGIGDNQKEDGKEGGEANDEDREWRHWGDK